MAFKDRLMHAWNAFINLDTHNPFQTAAASYGSRPDRTRLRFANERSIISAIYNRIAIDVAELVIKHVRLDDQGRFSEEIKSGLNECLNLAANVDQEARAFRQDIVLTLFDEGAIAIVPIDTTINPNLSGSFDILSMRVGKVVRWEAESVLVSVYNAKTGRREEIPLKKSYVAIVENPLYTVM